MKKLAFTSAAFTLAEILIVLVIIGVITAILLPVAIQSSPDEKVMKFKKGNATLGKVISELVNSDKYYADGDLGIKSDGNLLNSNNEDDIKYFCESFADVVSAKSINCSTIKNGQVTGSSQTAARIDVECSNCDASSDTSIETNKRELDNLCKQYVNAGEEIVTTDNIVFYQTSPGYHFGIIWDDTPIINEIYGEGNNPKIRLFGCYINAKACFGNKSGFDRIYKVFCMDIDGINKGEPPFGYGIRADGKILTGKRADEWINKSIQKGDN